MIRRRGLPLPPPLVVLIACWSMMSLMGTAFGGGGGFGFGGGSSTSSSSSSASASASPTTAPAPPPSSYASESIGGIDGRYSFSLTTFDPAGVLRQVRYATRASSLGTPLLATYLPPPARRRGNGTGDGGGDGGGGGGGRGGGGTGTGGTFVMVCPIATPTPLIRDDGTSRFVRISDRIVATHTGVGADGRFLLSSAARHAVEHEYAYDEGVPIGTFLEELSGLMQRYTMKPGVRPFGCSILVAHLGDGDDGEGGDGGGKGGTLYRVDPSGAVETIDSGGTAVLGRADADGVFEYLDRQSSSEVATLRGEGGAEGEEEGRGVDDSSSGDETSSSSSSQTLRLVRALEHGMTDDGRGRSSSGSSAAASSRGGSADGGRRKPVTGPKRSFLVATFSRGAGLSVETVSIPDDDGDGDDR